MNLSKAWNAKLEAASFLLSKILYKQCDIFYPISSLSEFKNKPTYVFQIFRMMMLKYKTRRWLPKLAHALTEQSDVFEISDKLKLINCPRCKMYYIFTKCWQKCQEKTAVIMFFISCTLVAAPSKRVSKRQYVIRVVVLPQVFALLSEPIIENGEEMTLKLKTP